MVKVLFLNVGWMDNYRGLNGDNILGGGGFVEQFGYGHEIFNFLPYEGRMYGYAEVPSINIERLGARPGARSVSGVLAIWTARNPHLGGTYIVGWYKNATVHRKHLEPTFAENRAIGTYVVPGVKAVPEDVGRYTYYFVSAAEDEGYLIPPEKRDFQVPRGKGGIGQRNIWYAEGPSMASLRNKVLRYVESEGRQSHLLRKKYGSGGEGPAHKLLKEWCAINPQALGLDDVIEPGSTEYQFVSGDLADIVFTRHEGRYAVVEVETTDPLPGAHQSLKYKTLLCARKELSVDSHRVLPMLVAWSIPSHVRAFCDKYSIKWIEKKI